ncbi:uncharacterized protein LOC131683927 [Topomyia yanbarensis]|uniref:uncharacterized protein LOC131683927 n=1 Tax=Topomyia yanbarensis TaxID=2498891 RepID=UPI00273B92D7|nr:uncharacterized protein LOC131683927 [Topomyia yanbarensis]
MHALHPIYLYQLLQARPSQNDDHTGYPRLWCMIPSEHWSDTYFGYVHMENDMVDVRIHDLAPRTKKDYIKQIMSQYGEVESITNDTWRNFFTGIPNGVRIVRMRVTKPISSYMTIECKSPKDGETYKQTTLITYPGQTPTCQFCNHTAHYGKTCAEATSQNSPTTANSNKQPPTPSDKPNDPTNQ